VRPVASVLAIMAVLLGAVAAALFGARDGRVLVSPPEAVGEGFLRALQNRRYDQARPLLSAELREGTSADDLRALHQALEARFGRIEEVEGEKGLVPSEAVEVLRTTSGRHPLTLRLRREHGEWRLADLSVAHHVQ
jgi:type II secretory pathway pseudopilin PulG